MVALETSARPETVWDSASNIHHFQDHFAGIQVCTTSIAKQGRRNPGGFWIWGDTLPDMVLTRKNWSGT